jgi:hypothetical protein
LQQSAEVQKERKNEKKATLPSSKQQLFCKPAPEICKPAPNIYKAKTAPSRWHTAAAAARMAPFTRRSIKRNSLVKECEEAEGSGAEWNR